MCRSAVVVAAVGAVFVSISIGSLSIPDMSRFLFGCDLRQWRRGACRSYYDTTNAGLSVALQDQPIPPTGRSVRQCVVALVHVRLTHPPRQSLPTPEALAHRQSAVALFHAGRTPPLRRFLSHSAALAHRRSAYAPRCAPGESSRLSREFPSRHSAVALAGGHDLTAPSSRNASSTTRRDKAFFRPLGAMLRPMPLSTETTRASTSTESFEC